MFGFFKKKPATPVKKGFRSFPTTLTHPAKAKRFSAEDFAALPKQKLQTAPSTCPGHDSTTIWYSDRFYIVEIRFTSHPTIYIQSACTFTPTMGMDMIDGALAQDAEEFILQEVLGRKTNGLEAFPPTADITTMVYLQSKGFTK